MKKILVIHYSQTGQLRSILDSITSVFDDNNIKIFYKDIKPLKPYPFPWDFMSFMDAFPESVYLDPVELEPFEPDENEYDLIILGYQVWFLSPSIPTSSFLKSRYAQEKLKNKPVITVIGCRNMWIMAQEKLKSLLNPIGAKLIDNIVLVDQGHSLATFITTPRWMLTGKKDSLWGVFPKAGIQEEEILNASRFGYAIQNALDNDLEKKQESLCYGLGAVNVDEKLIKSEQIATKSFYIWGKLIKKMGKQGNPRRKPFILLYTVFLIFMILTVVPINMLLQAIARVVNPKKVLELKNKYELPSGSKTDRIKEF